MDRGGLPGQDRRFRWGGGGQDVDTLSRYEPTKRLALVACLVHTARMQARDDLAEMFCKRVAGNVKKAKTELEEIRQRQRATSERLIGTYRGVLEHLDPDRPQTRTATSRVRRRAVRSRHRSGRMGLPARWRWCGRRAGSPPSWPTSRRCRPSTATTTRCWCTGSSARTGR
ncbi:hypothetical protein [Actinoallomurus sp. NPDC050550]|uniref:hypothetical protein n=1 Tax=Actinoallomurus sp. NPDC050550 TaxID=3154937 RepID=UPI0033D5C8E2